MESLDHQEARERRKPRVPSVGLLLVIALFVVTASLVVAYQCARSGIRQVKALGGGVSINQNTLIEFKSSFLRIDDELLATDGDVRFYWLEGPRATDDVIRVLRRFKSANSISVRKSNLSDIGLEHITATTQLTCLDIQDSPHVTDAGLARLERLPNLTKLQLEAMQVTGEGIATLTQLEELDLNRCQSVSDTTLERLRGLSNLTALSIRDTGVTDDGLRHLASLTRLVSLDLGGTKITDQGLETIIGTAPDLTWLSLCRLSAITDEGVLKLASLKSLERLYLQSSNISAAAAVELKDALPACEIIHD